MQGRVLASGIFFDSSSYTSSSVVTAPSPTEWAVNCKPFSAVASTMAFKEAFHKAGPQLLEPLYDLEVMCEADVMGSVMGDLQTRRAIIMGMDADGHYQVIKARVPLKELHKYSSALRALTQGKAKFSIAFAEYGAVPPDIQKKLTEEYQKEQAVLHTEH